MNNGFEAAPDTYAGQSFGDLARRMAGNTSLYTVGVLAVRFGGLLLIPLYWRFLSPDDYGVLAVASIVSTFTAVFLGLSLQESITRFYHAWPAAERRERLGSIWLLDWGSSFLLGLPALLWGGYLFNPLIRNLPFYPLLQLAVAQAILLSLSNTPMMTLRAEEKPGLFVSLSLLSFLFQTMLAIVLVAGFGQGARGVLLAQVGAGLLMTPAYAVMMLRRARLTFHLAHVGEALRYSLPIVPAVLVEAAQSVTDRFVLEKFVPLNDLGLYSVSDSLAGVARSVTQALKTAWIPFQMRAAAERTDAPRLIARMGTYFAAGMTLFALGLAALAPDLVALIGVEKYRPVASLVPPFVLPHLLWGFNALLSGGLGIARKTKYAWRIAAAHLAVSLVAAVVLIPRFGWYGALLANTLGVLLRVGLSLRLSQRFYPIPFEWRKIGALMAGAVAALAICRLVPLPPSWIGLLARGGVLAAHALLAGWFVLDGRKFLAEVLRGGK